MRGRMDSALPRPSLVARVIRGTAATGLGIAMLTTGLIVLAIAGAESGRRRVRARACLAILPVPIYLGLVLWIDRFEPEPIHMIVLTFRWGATIACFVAILLNTIGEVIVAEELGTEAGRGLRRLDLGADGRGGREGRRRSSGCSGGSATSSTG